MGRELVQFSPLINRNDLHREIGYGRLLLCCNEESRGMASLNRGFDIGPLGNGCFISRISVVQLGLRCATQSSGKISRLRLLRRRGFHSTWTRPGIRKGEGGRRMKLQMRDDVTRIYFHARYNFVGGRPPEEKSLSRRFCNQTDPWIILPPVSHTFEGLPLWTTNEKHLIKNIHERRYTTKKT